jgi:hypothetical protein
MPIICDLTRLASLHALALTCLKEIDPWHVVRPCLLLAGGSSHFTPNWIKDQPNNQPYIRCRV